VNPKYDLTGQVFGRLTAISPSDSPSPNGGRKWNCLCQCGKAAVVLSSSLRTGVSQSCGCLGAERRLASTKKHGLSRTVEARIWVGIRGRCLNPSCKDYPKYGGRGITMSEDWENSFEAFYRDMGPRPSKDYSVDRIDNSKGYSKENCRWATHLIQNRNKRINVYVTKDGQTRCIAEWAQIHGLLPKTVHHRITRGWPEHLWFSPSGRGIPKEAR
jgi:hypothetical protein